MMHNMAHQLNRQSWRIRGILAISLILVGCNDMAPGQGQVLNTETNSPIEGVDVRFDCQVGANVESFRTLRIVPVLTDKQGIFRFTREDLHGCQFGTLTARKDGYVNLSGADQVYESMNRAHGFWLAPQAEAAMRKLKNLHASTIKTKANEKTFPFSEGPKVVYSQLFYRFVMSKSIAKTERERQFVIDNYCSRLIEQYAQLSIEDKEALPKQREWVSTEPSMTQVTVNHEREVLGTCRGVVAP